MRPCETCCGFGTVTVARDTGVIGSGYLYEELCPDCDGAAEVEALCLCCDGPLQDDGYCAACEEYEDGVVIDPAGYGKVAA